ncbi:MAG: helix-turn-helix domain-containing protein [Acidimicrobiia bacterium]|nr:helix-turn-helix domain-containing protein [Acidimicrobiia bacterium]MBV8610913.1 helix-turn-helix domain-containing protein [Singulisphaera sp.]
MHVHDHLPLDELQRLAQALTCKRVWVRHQAVILALQGRSAAEIATALGCSLSAVQKWVAGA